ncbi:MAG TPA: multicopper oxidase domain-containing protein [Gammaproteobacteria bacterium]|nr:multicopper oxidase domain-containing protein [Gammaproteobacteria bacterium]
MERNTHKIAKKFINLLILLYGISNAFATDRIVNLVVGYKTVYFAGRHGQAIAVNNQIPAPILHFKEGDHVTINVYNHLDQKTAIHWHGMLVPWQMDGVSGVTQKGIPPGGVFHYKFTLYQSGTYWYHAHADLQEQQGLYGGFLIDPSRHPHYKYTKDYVVILSDWSNTHPDQILANLKKEGDYYSPGFPLQPSLVKFIHDYRTASTGERQNIIDDYKMMQKMRMSIYDISDVAYDAFLLNGQPISNPWTAPVKIGDVVRLRFIGAGGSTIFHVKIPGTSMQMVHVEGNDVKPYAIDDFKIAPGETYDVLVKIQKNEPYIIYAESIDTLGAAYGALITAPRQIVNYRQVSRFPEPKPVMREMMSLMMSDHGSSSMKMNPDMPMNHSMNMDMPTEPTIIGDSISPPMSPQNTTGTKYQNLTAAVKTNDPNKPVDGVIKMELFGYMDRFIWFINGEPEYKAHPIILEPNKRYRFIFTNPSMMRHPMHFHGHWFILRNGHGSHDPLLHTIDIPPGATVTADVDTDASGQWLFHCHLLYHMMTGMSRVFQYSTLIEITKGEAKPQNHIKQTLYHNRPIVRVDETRPIDLSLVYHPMAHQMGFYLANFLDIGEDPFHNVQKLTFKGLYGRDYDKLELFTNDAEVEKGKTQNADIDIFYWHLIDQFWAIKGGANYFYRPARSPYWQPGIGLEGLMPYFIDTNLRGYYYNGSAKLDAELSRNSQITSNFFIRVGIRGIIASKTVAQAEIGSGLNQMRYIVRPYYRLMPGLSIFAEFENQRNYGSFKNMQMNNGLATIQNTLTFGLSMVF